MEGYLKGSATKNALEAAKNAPLPPRAEDDSSDEIQITEEDGRESADDQSADEVDQKGDKTATEMRNTTISNQLGATKRMNGLGLGTGKE